tara:strand:- start:184 stop:324 length:141 start_codon:yes stop_codon:yes gene_type:complete
VGDREAFLNLAELQAVSQTVVGPVVYQVALRVDRLEEVLSAAQVVD